MNRDLTVGSEQKVLLQFCLPLFGSVIFQQLYNIADSFTAGKFISDGALAAVGNSYEITLIFLAFSFGCNIGCSVVISQLFGAKRFGDIKTAVSTSFIACTVLSLLLMGLGIGFCQPMLKLIQTPADIFNDSALYLRIYVFGFPFVLFYNVATGIFSALGDSQTPFIFLVCSSVANIFADILFVAGFHMGVAGVAWATFICQSISACLAVLFVLRRLQKFTSSQKAPVFSWKLLKDITVIAIPSILQQSFISVGNIIIQWVINGFGSSVIAGYAAAVKLNNMLITALTTLGNGISNFSAQNLGADKPLRITKGFRAGVKTVWCICLPVALLYFFGSKILLGLFLKSDSVQALAVGVRFLQILAPFYMVISLKLIADGVLRGTGHMTQFMIATFTDLILRVVFALVLSETALGTTGIWLAWPVGWTIATAISLLFYRKNEKTYFMRRDTSEI